LPEARSKRHDALPIVRLSHTRQGAVDRTRLMPPCGRRAVPRSPPKGAARAAAG
jgi:hypothetical protein